MAEPTIPQPVTSGATDVPNAPQSGQPQAPSVPEGFADAPPGPQAPEGFSDTPPAVSAGNSEDDNGPNTPGGIMAAPISGIMTGIAKGAGQTVNTISKLLNKIPIAGEFLAPKEGIDATEQLEQYSNNYERVGGGLEGIGEFFLLDGALKGLSIADRLDLGSRLAKFAQSSPIYAKIIEHGMNAVRGGSAATLQALAHGASAEDALKQGATAAVVGAGAGAATEGITAGVNKVKGAVSSTLSKAAASTQDLQPEFQQGIKDLVSQVADEVGVAKSKAASIRNFVGETANNIEDKAVKLLKDVDNAAGEPFVQKFRQRLANIRREINSLPEAGGGPEEARLEAERTAVMDDMEAAMSRAEQNGVPRAQLDEGLQLFKRAQAMHDVDRAINMPSVTRGLRPDVGTAAQSAADPENVVPSTFFNRMEKMYGSNGKERLQEAFGEDRAKNMLLHASEGNVKHAKLIDDQLKASSRISKAKNIGLGVAGGVAGSSLVGAGALMHSMMKDK